MKASFVLFLFIISLSRAFYDPFYSGFQRPRRFMQQRNPSPYWNRQRPMHRPRMQHDRRNMWQQQRDLERNEAWKIQQAKLQAERAKFEAEQAESRAKLEAEQAEARAQWEAEQAKLESERAEAEAKLESERRAEAERKAKAEREERLKQAKIKACGNWEKSLTEYLAQLQPLKLKPEVHRRNDHFDMYTVFVQLPSDLSVADLNIRVQGPTLTLAADRPITIPKHLQGYDFCEPQEEIPESQTWERTWEFDSPIEVNEIQAEIVQGHKLKLQFPNPPEHEIFRIPIQESLENGKVVSSAVVPMDA